MKTLLAVVPNPKDVTSFYRATGPLGELTNRPEFQGIGVLLGQEVYDEIAYLSRAAFMQRPFHQQHYEIAKLVKRNGRPLWIDYDDDLFDVPMDNPAHDQYSDPTVRRHMAEIVAMADIITVTTEALKEKLSINPMKGKDIRVVPNAIDLDRLKTIPNALDRERFPHPHKLRKPVVLWRGSKTHTVDVLTVAQEMNNCYKIPKIIWTFLGDRQILATSSMVKHDPQRILFMKELQIIEYFQQIVEVAPMVFIAPLVNNAFNQSKSNIAFLEATFAGSLCIAPKFKEWDVPGCLTYETPEEFETKLKQVLRGELKEKHGEAVKWVYDNRRLSVVNDERAKILREIMY